MLSDKTKDTRLTHTTEQKRFVFLLLDQFTMLSFASAIEPLRLANRIAERQIYTWTLAGEGGTEAVCSNGISFKLDMGLEEVARDDVILVCGGINVRPHYRRQGP